MARPLPLLLAISAGFAVASACYSERQAPPAFRYKCNSNADCFDNEVCLDGLCQVQCTQATFSEVCTADNHLYCLNGVCSTGCDPTDEESVCPQSQECIDLGLQVSVGGFIGGGGSESVGLCGTRCTDTSCPEAEVCIEGLCVATCENSSECGANLVCLFGLCVPEGAGTTGDLTAFVDESSTADDGTDTGAADTTAGTGGAT